MNGALLEAYALIQSTAHTSSGPPPNQTVRRFFPSSGLINAQSSHSLFPTWAAVSTQEDGSTITRGTTGLKTWEASLSLAAFVVDNSELLSNGDEPKIIELGCGSGFLSIVAANVIKAKKATFTLTDLDGEVLQRTEDAIKTNSIPIGVQVDVHPLDWKDVQSGEEQCCQYLDQVNADVVLAADIVYDPDLIAPLCATLTRLLRKGDRQIPPVAYIASTVRNPSTFALFQQCLELCGLEKVEMRCDRPIIDLGNLQLLAKHATMADSRGYLPLFPATHDPCTDGHVVLLRITAR